MATAMAIAMATAMAAITTLTEYRLARPRIGLAYTGAAPSLLKEGLADYIEVPFELLDRNPSVYRRIQDFDLILHCASLSLAGDVLPDPNLISRIGKWARRTRTPWVGEHVAAIEVSKPLKQNTQHARAVYSTGFTLSPPACNSTLRRVCENLARVTDLLNVPLIVENSPVYFLTDLSELSHENFMSRIITESGAGMLLDLTHYYVTSKNLGFDPLRNLRKFPLESVIEVHLSGVTHEGGLCWDYHASPIPRTVLSLLEIVLSESSNLRAVTLEFNWGAAFSSHRLITQLSRVRKLVDDAHS